MRLRALLLLAFSSSLLIQQLPLDLAAGAQTASCCAMGDSCPMSARPAGGARAGSACPMKESSVCSMRASCPTGRHHESAIPGGVAARPAVLDEAGWTQALVVEGAEAAPAAARPETPGASPPTPPPEPLLA